MPEGVTIMLRFAVFFFGLLEAVFLIPVIVGAVWFVVYILKPVIWFLGSTLTLSALTLHKPWYDWYGYWDIFPQYQWHEILIVTVVSVGASYGFEEMKKLMYRLYKEDQLHKENMLKAADGAGSE
jgi:hypothetical protein